MSGRTDPRADHLPWAEWLPWYVNGTLAGFEHERLEAHLAGCLVCRRELKALQALRASVKSADDPALAPQRGFASVMARIDAADSCIEDPRPGRWLARCREAAMRTLQGAHPAVRGLLAVQAALVLTLAGLLLFRTVDTSPAPPPAEFRTLSATTPAQADARALLRVVFGPDVTLREIGQVTQTIGARLLQGPDPTGACVLALVAPPEHLPAMTLAALDALVSHPAVVAAKAIGTDTVLRDQTVSP